MKNVFCLEGMWDVNLKYQSTIEPVLQLLEKRGTVRYIHKNCATKVEMKFYLNKWGLKQYDDFPILYLAFHGSENSLSLADDDITLDELSEILEDKCKGRVLIFGSCSTLNIDRRNIARFLKRTGALAVCGYKTDIDWVKSTVNDLLLIEALQENEFSGRGIEAIVKKLKNITKKFKELEFRVVSQLEINKKMSIDDTVH
ncbi:DUF6642 family protein [Mangrovibacterium diazotrophicum]|uniref:CHAT domain-containing protein n=1 Tax=Mangrovibacterium diazotrophicum TaxID=1261403 RepID=A0A419W6G0_9BACT|nr:DUF6642 family protein [Mangrovibacterium diazotrophicum]RKD91036.1 hypothetical protein BC643_1385 [Mangrovibacterium diazotrophicum]